jgi:hypothetical protein
MSWRTEVPAALHITLDAAMRRRWHKHAGGYERTKEVTPHPHHRKVSPETEAARG